jgi:hypothetical protein
MQVLEAREDEQQVGQAVQVDDGIRNCVVVPDEVDHPPFGPPADGARDVERGAALTAAGRMNERSSGSSASVVDPLLHARDPVIGQRRQVRRRAAFDGRRGEVRADGEQVGLDGGEVLTMVGSATTVTTQPRTAFSSSTAPYASTRGCDLATRPPPNRPVSPVSPVRV